MEQITFGWVVSGLLHAPPPLNQKSEATALTVAQFNQDLQCKTVIWSHASPLTVPLRGFYATLQISHCVWRPAPHLYEVRLNADGFNTINTPRTNLPCATPKYVQLQPRRTVLALNDITLCFGASCDKTRLLVQLPDESSH